MEGKLSYEPLMAGSLFGSGLRKAWMKMNAWLLGPLMSMHHDQG